jgi:hypothetical protein
MARRRRSRRALGALGEPITGSLLLWVGIPALLLWLAGKKKKPEAPDLPSLPPKGDEVLDPEEFTPPSGGLIEPHAVVQTRPVDPKGPVAEAVRDLKEKTKTDARFNPQGTRDIVRKYVPTVASRVRDIVNKGAAFREQAGMNAPSVPSAGDRARAAAQTPVAPRIDPGFTRGGSAPRGGGFNRGNVGRPPRF